MGNNSIIIYMYFFVYELAASSDALISFHATVYSKLVEKQHWLYLLFCINALQIWLGHSLSSLWLVDKFTVEPIATSVYRSYKFVKTVKALLRIVKWQGYYLIICSIVNMLLWNKLVFLLG